MVYYYSSLDNQNLQWFHHDTSRATLLSIYIAIGKIRSLQNLKVDFLYPITAIAGRNGSGKTTILALAACAYHNSSTGFRLSERKYSYYTFSDFFIQTSDEVSNEGITIRYQILHNKWWSPKDPAGRVGPGWQARRKKWNTHRWNKYSTRVKRTVVYFGINRLVPHVERSRSRTYLKQFQPIDTQGWEEEVQAIVGRILGTDYTTFNYKQHSKYRLPVVTSGKSIYSGFNMGAGEDALFEFFSVARECPDGSLLLIDEIELGLHEEAQARLIHELKRLCEQRKFQVICTTHSPRILESLPPESRIFLERIGNTTHVIPEISSAYATGKLSGLPNVELDILVEDDSAKLIVESCLSTELRSRVKILPIGSALAVMRHLAARYKEDRPSEVCVFLDGDKSSTTKNQIKGFLNALENPKNQDVAQQWVERRLSFLPGNEWPEAWVVGQKSDATYERLYREFQLSREQVDELLGAACRAGKHNEFYEASKILNFDKTIVAHQLIKSAFDTAPSELQKIMNFIKGFLDNQ